MTGELAQMVERLLRMQEVLGLIYTQILHFAFFPIFIEFLDAYIKVETHHLDYIHRNQQQLRVEWPKQHQYYVS